MRKKRTFFLLGWLALFILGVLVFWLFFWPKRDLRREFTRLIAAKGAEKPNILLITLDTTRADHLPCYGYQDVKTPNLDALAQRGIVFEECIASAPLTLPSHCSIMTGLYPTFHGVRVNGNAALSEQHQTLAETFAQNGYECGAFIGAFVLDGRWGLRQGFHHYDDQFDLKKYKQLDLGSIQRPGNQVADAALAWLKQLKDKPFFAWVHFYDPHTPYEPPEPYFSEYNSRGPIGLYDGEIAFMDEQLGKIIAWLKEKGVDKKTVIVIVGDHGEGLGNHGELTHGYFIYDYAIRVPLLVIVPVEKLQGIRVKGQVRTIDIFPTLLDMVGLPIPEESQGQSLLPLIFHPNLKKGFEAYSESMTPDVLYGWSPLLSLRNEKYKYIDAPRPELYDLSQDPEEFRNIQTEHPQMAQEMKKALDGLVRKTSSNAPALESANLDRETLERLAALGYIGGPVSRKSREQKVRTLLDPKDKLQVYEAVQQAGDFLIQEKYDEARQILESILRQEEGVPQALLLLATCYIELKRKEEAKAQYDLILKDDPNNVQALVGLANVLLEEEKKEDVVSLCKKALTVDEKNVQAYNLIGEVFMDEKNYSQSLPYLEKAVEIQPKLTQNTLNLAICLVGLGRYEEAEGRLKDILTEYPKFPLVYFHLGLLYEGQGKLEEAMEAYKEEFGLYPDHYRARFNYGRLLFKFNDYEGYKEQMREVIRTAPQAAEGYLFLARGLLYDPVDLNQAQKLAEKGLSLAKTGELKSMGYFLLADVYTRKNQPDKAKEALEKANSFGKLAKSSL
jgi:arylsulfatase A-like enzyme/tetratricopeptide (TPR) repeat protein